MKFRPAHPGIVVVATVLLVAGVIFAAAGFPVSAKMFRPNLPSPETPAAAASETGGAVPTVTGTSPSFAVIGTVPTGATSLQINFSESVTGGADAANFDLRSQGPDGLLGTGDDPIVVVSAAYAGTTTTLTFAALTEGIYRLTVKDAILNSGGTPLDGDGNGFPGGNWVRDFVAVPQAGVSSTTALASTPSTYNSAIADFNNDGWQDIAYAAFSPALIYYNNQAGGFTGPTTVNGAACHDVAAADFNNDGWVDLVGANACSTQGVSITLNNGLGGFGTPANISLPSSWYSVVTGDYNEDGNSDIAVAGHPNQVRVMFGNGSGGFPTSATLTTPAPLSGAGSGAIHHIATGDVNNDGHADLATANMYNNATSVFLGVGNGTFSGPTTFSSSTTGAANSGGARYVTIGDVNLDGDPDLVVADPWFGSTGVVTVLLGNGTGTSFSLLGSYATGPANARPYSVQILDFDGDLLPDLVAANNSSSIVFLKGNGSGTFATTPVILAPVQAHEVNVGDFNRDGRPDLVSSGNSGRVLLASTTPPVTTLSHGGFSFDLDPTTFGAGELVQGGAANAFDGLNRLQVNGADYAPSGFATVADGGRTMVTAPQTLSGLSVNREITVPSAGSESFARTIDVFTNPTAAGINVNARIVGNLGSDAQTALFDSSANRWIGTDDADGSGSPAIVHYFHGLAGLQPSSTQVSGDNIYWDFNFVVPAGSTVRLAHFTILDTARLDVVADANVLVTPTGFGGEAAAFLTQAELASIINFDYSAAEIEVTGNNVVIADGDSTPSLADHTDFGSVSTSNGTISRTFTIHNRGALSLDLTGTPKVQLHGPEFGDFSVTVQPSGPVSGYGSTTFTIEFDPSAVGLRTAYVDVFSNDPDENPYNFAITGTGANSAPDAQSQSVTTPEDTPLGITLVATDAENDALTYSVVDGPSNGALSGTAPNVIYTPNGDYNGPDSFTFKANDGTVDSNIATVTITVSPVNDAPQISSTASTTATEDTLYTYPAASSDIDGPGAVWSLVAGTHTCGGSITGAGVFTFTPAGPVPPASCVIAVRVCDGGSPDECATQTTNVQIEAINDSPVIDTTPSTAATEDVAYTYDAGVLDPDGPGEIWSLDAANTCGGSIHGSTGLFTFTPAGPVPPASCVMSVRVCDAGSPDLCDIQTTTINIAAVNDAPVIDSAPSPNATEDVAYSYDASVLDADGPGAVWSLDAGNTCGGSINASTGLFTFTPAGPVPPASCVMAIKVCDTGSPELCAVQTATIQIAAVNDPPTIVAALGITRTQGAGASVSQIATVADPDNAANTLTVTVNNSSSATVNGVTVSNITVNAAGQVSASISAACGATNASFTLRVTDAGGLFAQATLNVTVVNETVPPVINPIANVVATLPSGSATSMPVSFPLPTATDNCSAVTVTTSPVSGSVFNVGTTVVNVTATDANGNTSTATFTVTVQYPFAGFGGRVSNPPAINYATAGNTIPISFSLNGNRGLNIFAPGSPSSQRVNCMTGAPIGASTPAMSSIGLFYLAGQYTYYWTTDPSWAGTCRTFTMTLNDGTTRTLNFSFFVNPSMPLPAREKSTRITRETIW